MLDIRIKIKSQSPLIGSMIPTEYALKALNGELDMSQSPLIGSMIPTALKALNGEIDINMSQSPLIGSMIPTESASCRIKQAAIGRNPL